MCYQVYIETVTSIHHHVNIAKYILQCCIYRVFDNIAPSLLYSEAPTSLLTIISVIVGPTRAPTYK